MSESGGSKHNNDDFSCFDETSTPHIITWVELSDLLCNLDLSKSKAEMFASRLQLWNLLEKIVRVTLLRTRHSFFDYFFKIEENLAFCLDIDVILTVVCIVTER